MTVVRPANDIFRDFFFRYEFIGNENNGLIYYQFNEGPSPTTQMFSKNQIQLLLEDLLSILLEDPLPI